MIRSHSYPDHLNDAHNNNNEGWKNCDVENFEYDIISDEKEEEEEEAEESLLVPDLYTGGRIKFMMRLGVQGMPHIYGDSKGTSTTLSQQALRWMQNEIIYQPSSMIHNTQKDTHRHINDFIYPKRPYSALSWTHSPISSSSSSSSSTDLRNPPIDTNNIIPHNARKDLVSESQQEQILSTNIHNISSSASSSYCKTLTEKPLHNNNNCAIEDEPHFELRLARLNSYQDFRINYLRKLSYANVWIPQARRPPAHQTVCIFDWDDTLLCTSYINLCGQDAVLKIIEKQLGLIEKHVSTLLMLALKMGRVFIITNAMPQWVDYSVQKYLPSLGEVLKKVPIISARQKYEASYPRDCHRWKAQAFLEVRKTLGNALITNLISVGDSTVEIDAVHVMAREFSQALIKTIKFRESPSPDDLAKQLELVGRQFERICLCPKNLKIGRTVKHN